MVFPLVKLLKKSPDAIGLELGNELTNEVDYIDSFLTVKGFLNLKVNNTFFLDNFENTYSYFDNVEAKNQTVMVEYSSPNTNKPLHLGHIRRL